MSDASPAGPGSPARVALIGDPVAGSVSPQMIRAAFRSAGLDLDYTSVRVGREELVEAFPSLRERFVGLNVTIPLKEAVIPLLDRISPQARRAGSVNTIVFAEEAVGHSTDGAGFMAALRRARAGSPRRAVILGTGGAARAVSAALADAGCDVTVWGRNEDAGRRLASDIGVVHAGRHREALSEAIGRADLLVNTTPIGSEGSTGSPLPGSVRLHPGLVVFDLVYRPRRTALLRGAEAVGCRTVEGIEMLVEQGARSFRLWTGLRAPVTAMRNAAHLAVDDGEPVRLVAAPAGGMGP